ncbi:carbohydrate-binding module family 13 protein [Rhizophagus irregularis DAOM 181602=DAOM 197198]|nr:carbohydrate-binding module family 13 protein [Rhizophagus irregularis DAOM 181602=DAOM 197198]
MSFAHSFFKNLSDNYKTLFNQAKIDGDVTIIVGCEKDAKTNSNDNIFKAHSLILSTQSPWFKTILSDNKKKDEENIVIDLPNISSSTFNILLKYLYYGEINISLLSGKDIFELLIAMNELKINGMSDFLQDILLISHENWFQENFFFTYKISLKHQELQKLQKHFDKIIQYQPDMLFYSKDFVKIDKDLLIDVIKKDNLVMSEIDIWRKLILWGKESVNNSKVITNWNEEDFKVLKSTLDDFFPLIRFNRIIPINYYYEVRPYEKIIPEKIKEGIIQYHLTSRVLNSEFNLSPRIGVIDSTVITSSEAAQIATWIIKSNKPLRFPEIPYEFKLLLRGSQDGFNSEIFHSKCLDINNTLVVIRIAGTRKVIGGYNPLAWKKCVEWKPITHNFGASGFGSFGPPSSTSKSSDFGAQPLFNGIFGSSTTQSSNLSNITKTTQIASTVGFGTPSSTTQNKRKSLTGFTGFGTSPFTTQSSNSSQITSTTKPSVGSGTLSSTTQSSNSSQITSTTKPSVGSGTLSSTTQSSNSSQITSTTKPSVGSGTLSSTTQSSNSSQITSTSVGLSSLSQITSTTKSSVGLGSPFSSTQSSSISLVTTQSSFSSLQITTQSARTNVNTSPRFPLVTTEQQNLDFLSCKESFIFSFNYDDNDVNVNEIKFTKSDVEDSNYGIGLLLSNSTGPRFGNGDLIMSGNNFRTDKMCSCNQTSYKKPIIESNNKFSVDEYEVFQIISKPIIRKPFILTNN